MPDIELDEENVLARSGVADRDFADHSGEMQQGYELGSLTRGLVAYYAMEEGQGQVLHDGALNNLGQIVGSPGWVSGTIGATALDFNGSSEYVDLGQNPFSYNEYTLSCWVKFDTLSSRQKAIGIEALDYFEYDNQNDDLRFSHWDEGVSTSRQIPGITPTTGVWYHLVGVFNGNEAVFYIDGVEQGSESSGGSNIDSYDRGAALGANRDGSADYLDGQLEEVRIYDRPLSQPEAEALYNLTAPSGAETTEADVPSRRDGGLARYEFENDVADSWGGFDGTDNTSAGFVDGVYGQAKDFDGSDDYIEAPDMDGFDREATFSAWVKPSSSQKQTFVMQSPGTGSQLYYQIDPPSSEVLIEYEVDSVTQVSMRPSNFEADVWSHVVLSMGTDYWRHYVNGSLVASTSGSVLSDFDSTIYLGSYTTGNDVMDGPMDDIRFYERALDPIEVEQLFNKGAYRINRSQL